MIGRLMGFAQIDNLDGRLTKLRFRQNCIAVQLAEKRRWNNKIGARRGI